MKSIFLSSSFILFISTLHAQVNYIDNNPDNTKNNFLITTDYLYGSNAITYELTKTYYQNGFITEDMKNNVSKNLSGNNRLGGILSIETYYRHTPDSLFGTTNLSWTVGLRNVDQFHSSFSDDLFEVYFRGNKNYAGKTADFSEFNYRLLKYQQLQFGISKLLKSDSSTWEFGGSLGFNVGQQLLEVHSSNATLFTEEIGTYIDVGADIEIHASDSLKKKFGSFNGFGMSTDLFFKSSIKEKHFLFFKVSNLGFIRWNDQSSEVKADTSFRFEGIDVNDLFTFADTITTTLTNDSILKQNFLSQRKYQGFTSLLPAKFEVSYKRRLGHSHVRAGMGMNYIIEADYIPQVQAGVDYSWSSSMITLNVSYGGYADFGTGIFYQHRFKGGYFIMVGSNYMNLLFDISKSRSQNIGFTFYRNF